MPAPTWAKNKKVAVYPEGWSEEKTNLTPGTYLPYVRSLDRNDQSTLVSLADEHHMAKKNVLALANLRSLYTNLAHDQVKISRLALMYNIVEAVLAPLGTGIDEELAKAFIFGSDYDKLCRMITHEEIELLTR